MKSSKKETHKWLRKHESITTGVMMNKDGIPTANKDDMFNLIREAWDKVFNKYSRGEPDPALFFQHFGSDMKSHPQQLDPLTGSRLIQTLRDIQPSSTGLDGWSIAEPVALSKWYPNMFSHLANILNLVEEIGVANIIGHGLHHNASEARWTCCSRSYGYETDQCVTPCVSLVFKNQI